jgi:broad specificity phosphatase PhoE
MTAATPPGPGELIILRHGETEWSRSGRHTGRTDLPLTGAGEAAARALAPVLAARDIQASFTSPASRAVRTAELAGLAGANTEPDLQEWDYGGYEGKTTPEIRAEHPGWYLWRDGIVPGDAAHPGETLAEVGKRADAVLARVRPLLANGDALAAAGAGRRAAVPARHRDHEHARSRARRARDHLLERAPRRLSPEALRPPARNRPR